MLFVRCPTCGFLLAGVQRPYQEDMLKLCEKYGISHETLSSGINNNQELNTEKKEIVDKYTEDDMYCCKMRLTNFSNIVTLVK
jgi:DNA-directed RNA polymerase subunit N (RpoN/RPB10)